MRFAVPLGVGVVAMPALVPPRRAPAAPQPPPPPPPPPPPRLALHKAPAGEQRLAPVGDAAYSVLY